MRRGKPGSLRSHGPLLAAAFFVSLIFWVSPITAGTWVRLTEPPGDDISVLKAGETYLFASTYSGLYRTPLDEPGNWDFLGNPDGDVTDLVVAGPDDSHILATTDSERVLYRSTDAGQTWTFLDMTPGATGGLLAWNGALPGHVYFRLKEFTGSEFQYAVLASTDFGANWSLVYWCDDCYPDFLEAGQGGSETVYLGIWLNNTRTYAHRSTDAGQTWFDLEPDIGSDTTDEAATNPVDPDKLYVQATQADCDLHRWLGEDYLGASEVGLFGHGLEVPAWGDGMLFSAGSRFVDDAHVIDVVASADDGETWFSIGDGLGTTIYHWSVRFTSARSEPILFISYLEGLWMKEFNVSSVDDNPVPLHQSWVSEAYPNPAKGEIRLLLGGLFEPGARAGVFDAAGRRIRRLPLERGAMVLRWDGRLESGREARSGTYYVQVANGDRVSTRRVTLLR